MFTNGGWKHTSRETVYRVAVIAVASDPRGAMDVEGKVQLSISTGLSSRNIVTYFVSISVGIAHPRPQFAALRAGAASPPFVALAFACLLSLATLP